MGNTNHQRLRMGVQGSMAKRLVAASPRFLDHDHGLLERTAALRPRRLPVGEPPGLSEWLPPPSRPVAVPALASVALAHRS